MADKKKKKGGKGGKKKKKTGENVYEALLEYKFVSFFLINQLFFNGNILQELQSLIKNSKNGVFEFIKSMKKMRH
jgi:hypothetical protein